MVKISRPEINVFGGDFCLKYEKEGYKFIFEGENKTFYPSNPGVNWSDPNKDLVIDGKDESDNDISVEFRLERNDNGEIQKKVIDVIMN